MKPARPKGYADGGKVDPSPASSFFQKAIGADALAKGFGRKVEEAASGKKPDDKASAPPQKAKGGKITKVAGKPIGRDDGIIAAQRGEHVIRKAAAQKYGDKKMAAVNRGTAKVTVKR